jgi:beta-xylosidase
MHRPLSLLLGLHLSSTLATIIGPVITANFPDPSVIQVEGGDWYAFATNNGVYNVQIATSHNFENWTVLNHDALPNAGAWSDGTNVWAPDIREIVRHFFTCHTDKTKTDKHDHHRTTPSFCTTQPLSPMGALTASAQPPPKP